MSDSIHDKLLKIREKGPWTHGLIDPTRTFILFPQPVKGEAPKPSFYYNGSTTPNKDE